MQATQTQFKIGDRVTYLGSGHRWTPCNGTVVAIYPGGERHRDPETGEIYVTETHIGVKVDQPLPDWWPYVGKDRFAPAISELQPTP